MTGVNFFTSYVAATSSVTHVIIPIIYTSYIIVEAVEIRKSHEKVKHCTYVLCQ